MILAPVDGKVLDPVLGQMSQRVPVCLSVVVLNTSYSISSVAGIKGSSLPYVPPS